MTIHHILKKLESVPIHFSRFPQWIEETGIIECDCAGFLTILLKRLDRFPKELNGTPKAFEYFNFIKAKGAKKNISDLKKHDVIIWKKRNIPQTGDTGHIVLLLKGPKKLDENTYRIKCYEVTKTSKKLEPRKITLETKKDGTLHRIQWDPNSNKVKETELLGFSFFESQTCLECQFPEERCLCQVLPSTPWKAPEILILRHPTEKKHPLNTVNLLEKSFSKLQILDGEIFPIQQGTLVYPKEQNESAEIWTKETVVIKQKIQLPLILVDGTWKKSKKLLFLNPWLLDLPRVEINLNRASRYKLRTPKNERTYSTLEVFSFIWEKIEPDNQSMKLNKIFETFLEKQELFLR